MVHEVVVSPRLVEIEALLDQSVQRVGRAVRNMRELAVSGLPTSTPGNGSPGGGGGRTITVDGEKIPVTATEGMVLEAEPDEAQRRLSELVDNISQSAVAATSVVEQFTGQQPIMPAVFVQPMPLLVHSYRCARLLVGLDVPERWRPAGGWAVWADPVDRVWQLTQSWGWVPSEPTPSVQRELLATDLTGQWCRSCLRAGAREPRDRNNEMCTWCRKFEQLEGFVPPIELVQARADNKTITEQMVIPYRQAHRARQKKAAK